MSELDFDDISSMLEDVLADKPLSAAEPEPEVPEEVSTPVEESKAVTEIPSDQPTKVEGSPEADDILGDFLAGIGDEAVEALSLGTRDTFKAKGDPVTANQPEEPEPTEVDEIEAMMGELGAKVVEPSTPVEESLTNVVNETASVSEHVFAEPIDQGTGIPMPTFTTTEIAESLDIRNFATLVTLNTARWHAKVKDRKAAKDAADASGAQNDAFEARKKLLAGCDSELKAVHKEIDQARTEHYRLTMPWSTVGVNDVGKRAGGRLMPNTLFIEYTTAMAKCKQGMEAALALFEKKYPSLIAVAQKNLGAAFNPTEYPNPSSIAQHFRLSFDFNPIPVGTDFKGLQDAQVSKLGAALTKKTQAMLENAMQDAWKNLYESVQHAAATLAIPKQMFHGTLIDKLRNQAVMLTHLNATKDTRIEDVRVMVESKLTKWDAKDIRKDDALRKRLSEDAAEIVAHMEKTANA